MAPVPELPFALGPVLDWLNLAGTAVFAASGAMLAAEKKQTFVTFTFFAVATGVGGGTVRDLLIGAPVFWVHHNVTLLICLGGIIRDLLAGEPSILMRPELYVTAGALSAALFVGLVWLGLPPDAAGIAAFLAGFALRGVAIWRGWSLPAYAR
jgi:uncharacterized membrane protein YeiH